MGYFESLKGGYKANRSDISPGVNASGQPKATCHTLAAVDDDVLRPDAAFQHSHFGMVSSAAEQAGRLDAEVCDALFVVVHDAEAILLQKPLVFFFYFLRRKVKHFFSGIKISVFSPDSPVDSV